MKIYNAATTSIFIAVSIPNIVFGFFPSATLIVPHVSPFKKSSGKGLSHQMRICQQPLQMSSNQFDVSKPVFDILALRSVRGDALVRYNALNQSEPLRITLYGLLCLILLVVPSLNDVVGYDEMSVPAVVASYLFSAGSAGLTFRECSRRVRQLKRIEKELNSESLPIRLPMNALADRQFSKPVTLKDLRGLSSPPRIVALCGTKSKLEEALKGLSIFRRRLEQASVYVVVIPLDDGGSLELKDLPFLQQGTWLADPQDPSAWREYLKNLSNSDGEFSFRWFGLNSNGRSFGSGDEAIPLWIQIFGQHLRPTQFLDENDKAVSKDNEVEVSLLNSLDTFYQALTTGNKAEIMNIFTDTPSGSVTEVVEAGGRIDAWDSCLAEDARPQNMQTSGADVMVLSDTEAYTTVVEFPANTFVDSGTLLALQHWTRDTSTADWKLALHQTIPWTTETKAQGTLRCDCRGCVALKRGPERRTFGGMVG